MAGEFADEGLQLAELLLFTYIIEGEIGQERRWNLARA
jgi:hypothetical protein